MASSEAETKLERVSAETIQDWQLLIIRWAVRKGWHNVERSFGDWIALFHTELSEAYEDYRNHRKLNEIYYELGGNVYTREQIQEMLNPDIKALAKPCGIPIEIADLVIRVLHFCETYGIDLNEMIALKMAYNETRPHRHGGKKE